MQNQWRCPFLTFLDADQNFGTKLGSSRTHLFQASVFYVTSGGNLLPTFTGILCSERVNIGAGSFRLRSLLMFEMCWPEVPICDNRIHELIFHTQPFAPQTHAETIAHTGRISKKLSSKFAAFLAVRPMVFSLTPNSNKMRVQ